MALVRWEPGREVDSLQSEVNRVFDAFFGGSGGASPARRWVPAMDLVETDEHLVLRADLPGMKRDDVEIEIKDGALSVSGERKAEHEQNAEGYYRVERAYGRFSRSLTLPDGIEADAVEALFEDGVLEVRIPKPAERKPHRVAIHAPGTNVNGSKPETIEA
jgi:HSP20 family protein